MDMPQSFTDLKGHILQFADGFNCNIALTIAIQVSKSATDLRTVARQAFGPGSQAIADEIFRIFGRSEEDYSGPDRETT
jgi:hypothetical protein